MSGNVGIYVLVVLKRATQVVMYQASVSSVALVDDAQQTPSIYSVSVTLAPYFHVYLFDIPLDSFRLSLPIKGNGANNFS